MMILLPALTFVGTVNATNNSELNQLVDLKPWDRCQLMNMERFHYQKENVSKNLQKSYKTIVPVHIFGHSCDVMSAKIAKNLN